MALFGLFGKGSGKQASKAETPPEAELELYSGMQVEITGPDGEILFVARLLGIRENSAQLNQNSEAHLPQTEDGAPLPVQIRGYSDRDSKAVHLEGAITPRPNRVWLAENLKLIKTGNDRAFFRMDTNLNASVTPMGQADTSEELCRLLNISVGGARIGTDSDYQVGDRFLLRARLLPDREPTVILCQVLRIIPREQGKAEYGCRFLELNESDEDKITQIIFDMQRQKRAGL